MVTKILDELAEYNLLRKFSIGGGCVDNEFYSCKGCSFSENQNTGVTTFYELTEKDIEFEKLIYR